MTKNVKIIAARHLVRFGKVFRPAFTLPGIIFLVAFIIFGHIAVYRKWEILLLSWNPYHVSSFTGIVYLLFLLCSVFIHELGHLVSAIYKGELSAEVHIQINSWWPAFLTRRDVEYKMSKSGSPLMVLTGIFAQLLFASALGFIFLLTHNPKLPASIVLIDIAALASLVPTPGTDGYWFFSDILKVKDMRKEFWLLFDGYQSATRRLRYKDVSQRGAWLARQSAKMGIVLFFLYLFASLLILMEVIHQYLYGILINGGNDSNRISYEILRNAILLVPPVIFGFWALWRIPFAYKFIRRLLKSIFGLSSKPTKKIQFFSYSN